MSNTVLFQALIYLTVAVVFVPLAKRLGLGSVLGYLIAGVVIGPAVLGLVGGHDSAGGHGVMHFAEFGVVMMLFLVGLELRPALLWELRRPIFGLGTLQVVGISAAVAGIGIALGLHWKPAIAIGLILAMSSTAIVLQSLNEKGLMKTEGGAASFAVLLFQDLSVIPILAVFPFLAIVSASQPVVHAEGGASRPGWQQALFIVGAVALIIVAGRFVVRPLFRFLASTRLREVFTAFALFLVVGIAWLMQTVELSPALGTFLAGVVLADSEYKHELESDIEPFKGLLLGLFFISVGAQIDFGLIKDAPLRMAGLIVGTLALKTAVMLLMTRLFGLDRPARWLVSVGLSQVGEFAFVLISFATGAHIFGDEIARPLIAVVALTMLATPALFVLLERVILPKTADGGPKRAHDQVAHDEADVVMAGFGRVGQVIGRMLRMSGHNVTVLDLDPEMVDLLRRLGSPVYYGDASRLDLLVAAGCAKAKLFVLAIDDVEKSIEVAEMVRRQFPHLKILARARNRQHYYRLHKMGIRDIYRETMGTSLEMGEAAMRQLGVRAHTAHRIATRWSEHDVAALAAMLEHVGKDREDFLEEAKKAIANAEKQMRQELTGFAEKDPGWDNESLRQEANARFAAAQKAAAETAAQNNPP